MKFSRSLFFGFLIVLFAFSSCKNEKETVPVSEFAPYIKGYTGGIVYSTSSIWIELAAEQPDVELNTEVKEKLFSFTPALKEKAYWETPKRIKFKPAEGVLKNGQLYKASFHLGAIREVPKRLNTFNFTFQVEERNFSLQTYPLEVNKANPDMVNVKGEIQFSDRVADVNIVQKMFSAKMSDNQSVETVISRTPDAKVFNFAIENIQKKDVENTLEISVTGKVIGSDQIKKAQVTIPGIHAFEVLDAETIYQPEFGVQLTFSDPVSSRQDLKGLITLSGVRNYTLQVKDNKVNIYFDRAGVKEVRVRVNEGVRSSEEKKLENSFNKSLTIEVLKPRVELKNKGNILPDSENLIIPFKAVSLRAVDMKIIQIFEDNVLMFLQTNTLSGTSELRRSGRLVYKKTLRLDTDPSKDINQWNDYFIDLSKIIKNEPGVIYRIELSFKHAYSAYPCDDDENEDDQADENMIKIQFDEITEEEQEYWDNPRSYFYYSGSMQRDWNVYSWKERDNPCHPSYYMVSDRASSCNVMSSNLGIITKANADNKLWVAVNNILDTKPVPNVYLLVYNIQLQIIASATTDAEGFAVIEPKGKPFIIVAESGGQKTYLRLVEGEDNSMSRFDTGGKKIEKDLKGYIYGERGVWRPGDTVFVGFVLHDPEKRIPASHPVSFEMYNPLGQFYSKQIATNSVNGFYTFKVPTSPDDPTGLWNGYVKVGGTSFHKSFRIETIKPNRLKINLEMSQEKIDASMQNVPVTLRSSWLTGATARNLNARVEMRLSQTSTQFKGYSDYIFNNPAAEFYSNVFEVYDGNLDEEGIAAFNLKVPEVENAPGMLNAHLVARVFEPGGDASIYTQSIPFSPYTTYVGIRLNQPEGKYIETDTDHVFDIITLNSDGTPVSRNNLEYKIYRIGWSWWWQQENESFANYINSSSYTPVAEGELKTTGGKGKINFMVKYPSWGRYLVYVKDKDGGHATGGVAYIDWPDWRGRSNKSDPGGVKMLSFSTDKDNYEVGEEVTVIIPASSGGTVLVALENGSAILQRNWVQVSEKEDTKYKFKVTKEMAPNVYVHISLLQPHAQTVNDLPIRMYGVMPVMINDKNSRLEPKIEMPDVLRPETEFTVKVSEKEGKPMTYTLAVVDDGLLDLTNFKTPNPWDEFYVREALGIRTWDMYDYVIGAFAGKYGSLFSVGGDEENKAADNKANRFKPVVKFIGPFTLAKGKTNIHKITLPVYVGSVRTMVVAGQNGAYGKAEKTTPVRSPLMVLSSLPRVLSINEEIMLPVNVFVMENSVNKVSVKVETTGLLQAVDGDKKSMTFHQTGDDMVYFRMKTGGRTGVEKVTITASGNGQVSTETIEIDVRNPNPPVIISNNKLLKSGESADFTYQLSGEATKDDWLKLEVSRIPSVDISRRFDFLYDYQHYCSEQLTSRALPLLYIPQFKDVDQSENEKIKKNVSEAIQHLYSRQLNNGGIVYWPGQSSASDWITTYAGHFLILAKEKGYEVNENVINKWKSYQRREAQSWSASNANNYYSGESELQQAYRLYTLALAGAPELGAMNRMKEIKDLSLQARWRLAAAYAISGKTNAAEELIFNAPTTVEDYYGGYTYGSSIRDESMILETLVFMGRQEAAFKQAQAISKRLSKENYFSTQSTAYALVAMGTLAEKTSGEIDFSWTLNGKKQQDIKSLKAIYQKDLNTSPAKGSVKFTNNGSGSLYVDLVSKSKPLNDTLPAISNGLKIELSYTDLDNNMIKVSEISQGTDFIAIVKVSNLSSLNDYTDLALVHIIPSGWEIFNERMFSGDEEDNRSDTYTYRDIRDDRVLTYFDLKRLKSKTFKIRLQASYVGSFILPAVQCEAMYDTEVNARTKAGKVKVVK